MNSSAPAFFAASITSSLEAPGLPSVSYTHLATKLIMQLVGINLMIDGGLNLWVVLYTVKEHRNFRFHN